MKIRPLSLLSAASLHAVAALLSASSAQTSRAQTEPRDSLRILLLSSVDSVRIVQAAMPAYDRAGMEHSPHRVAVFDEEDYYAVYFTPMDNSVVYSLTVLLNKTSLEIVRIYGPAGHVRG